MCIFRPIGKEILGHLNILASIEYQLCLMWEVYWLSSYPFLTYVLLVYT